MRYLKFNLLIRLIRIPLLIKYLFTGSKKKSVIFSFLFLFFTFLFGYILIADRENIFTIKGETESLSVTFSQNSINQWPVSNGKLLLGFEDDTPLKSLPLESFLFPSSNTTARLLIKDLISGTKELLLILSSEKGSVGEIETVDGLLKLPNYIEITIPIEKPLTLPFDGQVLIGEDVGQGVDNILLSGSVKIIERQFFSDNRYIAGNFLLDSGDRVEIYADKKFNIRSKIKGFVRITDKNSFHFVVHGEGKGIEVNRLGSAGYKIGPTSWARITNDPIVIAIYTLAAMIFLFLEIYLLIIRLISQTNEE